MGKRRKICIFIFGTPYCGSTILGCVLNALPGVCFLGEVDRLKTFQQYEEVPSHYLCQCELCRSHNEYRCSFWTEEFIDEINNQKGLISKYIKIVERSNAEIVIDGSKSPRWFNTLLDEGIQNYVDVYGIISVKNVWAFAESDSSAEVNPQLPWRSAEIWRDVYIHSIRCCTTFMVPFLVIRNEDFRTNPKECIERVCTFLRIGPDLENIFETFIYKELHCLGGNMGAYVHHIGFDRASAIKKFPQWERRIIDKSGKPPIVPIGSPSKATLSDNEYAAICNVPGLFDLLGHLGYAPFFDLRSIVSRKP